MRLVFDPKGKLVSFYRGDPIDPKPPAPHVTIEADVPAYFSAGVCRAAGRGRISYENGKVCLDGKPYDAPPMRPEITYTQAVNFIGASTLSANLKQILYRICDQLLELGALEL
jgi:hypothetical protein